MKNILAFLIEVGKLKKIPRMGWVINQIENPESIADHVFRSTIMGWIFGKRIPSLNSEKIIKLALIHDLTKVYAVDTTPYDKIIVKKEDFERLKKRNFLPQLQK